MIEQLTLFGRPMYVETRRRPPRRDRRLHLAAPAPSLHGHSLAAREEREDVLTGRKAAVLAWLRTYGPATDREVRDGVMGEAADMNSVRPRITDLIAAGLVVEVGEKVDTVTGLKVRVVAAR